MIEALHNLIREHKNFITIEQFMDFALYDQTHGYYMKSNPIGKGGGFITAPEISQLFGETIAIWLILQWEKLGNPNSLNIVELGPGKGTLISDIIRVTHKYFRSFIYLYEISPLLQQIQSKTLSNYTSNIHWLNNIDQLPAQPTIFIANEFLDALPIKQFLYKQGAWYENGVTIKNNTLNFANRATDRSFTIKPEGSILELNDRASKMFNKIKEFVKNNGGAGLIIDYGYTEPTYTSTIQAIKNHKHQKNILEDVSYSDITAHVDFSIFTGCKISSQCSFLSSYGIRERAGLLLKSAQPNEAQEIMQSLHRLIHPELMGELFKCAIL